jgi:hypothetical protein
MKILVTKKQLKFLKSICILYKSSPYLTETQKDELIKKVLKPYLYIEGGLNE